MIHSLALSCLSLLAVNSQATLPGFNIFPIQNLVVTGLFDGLSFFPEQPKPPLPVYTNAIYTHHDGSITLLGKLGHGTIDAMCTLSVDEEYFLYVGGSFSNINGQRLYNVAMFDLQTKTWSSLSDGLNPSVHSIACDNQRQSVYFGTEFSFHVTHPNTGGIYHWKHVDSKWIDLPFGGVNGPVKSIVIRPKNNNVIIGGRFSSTLDGVMQSSPFANEIDLRNVDIRIETSSFENKDRLLCDDGQNLDFFPGANGRIVFQFPKTVIPSGIRIWNADHQNGIQQIKVFSHPSNQPIPISKVTPRGSVGCGTGVCWLDQTSAPQDFIFQNTDIQMTDFYLEIVAHYGAKVSIKKIKVFSYTNYAPAYPTKVKFDACENYLPEGPVVTTQTNEIPSDSTSIPATISKTLTLQPNFLESGVYVVSLQKSPNCPSSSCQEISLVNIKITPGYNSLGDVTDPIIKKKSTSDSLTEVHTGFFAKTVDHATEIVVTYSYPKPSSDTVKIDPIAGIVIKKFVSANDIPNLLEFVPVSTDSKPNGIVNSFAIINQAMEVTALATQDDQLYIGGILSGLSRVAQVDSEFKILMRGQPGEIKGLAVSNNKLYVGGDFQMVQPPSSFLKHLVEMDITKSPSWSQVINVTTDTPVTSLYQNAEMSSTILISGHFASNRDTSIKEPQLPYIEYNSLLKNISSHSLIDGEITLVSYQPAPEPYTFLVGRIDQSENVRTTNVAYFSETGNVVPLAASSDNLITSALQTAELSTGLMYVPHLHNPDEKDPVFSSPVMVIGGKSVPTKFPGVGILNGTRWQFLNVGKGKVNTLACSDNELFIGGDFDAGGDSQRLLVYSFKTQSLSPLSAPLSNKPDTQVNKMIRQYGTTKMIVSGRFDNPAGASDCTNLCLLDADLKSWSSLNRKLPAEVNEVVDIVSYENRIVLSGKKMNLDNDIYVYDVRAETWTPTSLNLPGFPSYLSYDNATRGLFISGKSDDKQSSYIYWWNEVKSHNLGQPLSKSPLIKSIMVLEKPLTSYEVMNLDFKLPPMGAILVTGDLILDSFGPCSGALFNGTVWKPYFTSSKVDENSKFIEGQASVFKLVPFFPRQREYLSTLFIILISLGIALSILIFIIALGLILLFVKHKRRQQSRAALVPLLSDISSVGPNLTSPLASPINPTAPGMILTGDEMTGTTTGQTIPMTQRHT